MRLNALATRPTHYVLMAAQAKRDPEPARQDGARQDGGSAIAVHYERDHKRQVPALGGGWPAFAVFDRREPGRRLMAVQVRPAMPLRARIVDAREAAPVPNVLLPLADGAGTDLAGQGGWFVICPAPPGPALTLAAGPWREQEIIGSVLLPAAAALLELEKRGFTHRAIRPDNLFRAGPGHPVTLGPFWMAPPGTGQPPAADPPFLGWCKTPRQGDGRIADDVYALGVTMLALWLGQMPLGGLDAQEILRRGLSLGSLASLLAGAPAVPTILGNLLRGMLAEDPDHRPSPALLMEPIRAAARRNIARPQRRAQRPIEVGGNSAWTARELAYALAAEPQAAWTMLRTGTIDRWLRRELNDPTLGGKLEEVRARHGADAETPHLAPFMLMRAVAALEPLAPVIWRGDALWPDGFATALAAADAAAAVTLREIVEHDVFAQWANSHPHRTDGPALRQLTTEWLALLMTRGVMGGLRRLLYALNPRLACASPLLAGRPVLRIGDVLPALEAASGRADRRVPPLDADIVAYVAAHSDAALRTDLAGLITLAGEAERPLMLRMFTRLQTRLELGPLPGLAAWIHESGLTGLDRWRSRTTKAALARRVATLVSAGQLAPLSGAVEDPVAFLADAAGARLAAEKIARLQQKLHDSEQNAAKRIHDARRLAHDLAAGTGLLAMLGATLRQALG